MPEGTIDTRVRAMAREELTVLWQRRWRRPPPKGLSRRLLEGNAAWLLQAEASGGLTAATRRRLDALARSSGSGADGAVDGSAPIREVPSAGRRNLRPGSRLIRQWHGRSHVVEVTDAGFTYEGRHFTSLTAIARAITGAGWSGPRFFGVNASAAGAGLSRRGQNRHHDGRQPDNTPANGASRNG
ncbi:DUF2924 domain-containing protein [Minwuia thermotolerans]|uniref:DUF2924 domain-containing protein n=1 Tax=Minwuia thermotolerans TaxID=2056226 RepID=UPI0019D0C49F|nr:DUF2924 domain-containing protein [Minwuia thermotolerans]